MRILTSPVFGLLLLLAALTFCTSNASSSSPNPEFRTQQMQFSRVRTAYDEHETRLHTLLRQHNIGAGRLEMFIRVFKLGRRMEVWGRETGASRFVLLRTFRLAGTSGTLGPKRRSGDGQVPEGFYTINRFNPHSNFYLSLGLDYPNADDLRYTAPDPGGDIFIHGSNVTIGCLPITDAGISELYVLAVEARASGQAAIPVHIFPFEMTAENLARRVGSPHAAFWQTLVPGYEYFENNHNLARL